MKRRVAVLLLCVMIIGILASCGKKQDRIIIGRIAGVTEEEDKRTAESMKKKGFEYKAYDSLSTMLLALDKGEVDRISVPGATASYLVTKNPEYEMTQTMEEMYENPHMIDGLGFLFLEENKELRDRFNDALIELGKSGKLSTLIEDYVVKMIHDEGYNPDIKMPTFEGKETITVAVTGDLPPMDYIDDEGNPAGYNIAILSEIANILEINIEFIEIESSARAIALTSGKCDVCFWTRIALDKDKFEEHYSNFNMENARFREVDDLPKGTIATIPYTENTAVSVRKKKAE